MNARFKEHVMAHPDGRERTVRFGGFEFDREGREVRKDGARIRLGGQPLQVLGILLENHEQVVTREELRRRLWGSDTFVDFEQGLNTAIARLRQALGDSADRPRFIETVPGEGYRFVGPIDPPRPEPGEHGTRLPLVDRRTLLAASLGLALGMGGAYLAIPGRETFPVRRARRFLESGASAPPVLPSAAGVDLAISRDGRRIVYRVSIDGSGALYFRDLNETESRILPARDVTTPFFSPDGGAVAFHRFGDQTLMRVSTDGGEPVRIAGSIPTMAGASWSSDGTIVFGTLDSREGLKQVSPISGAVRTLTEPAPGTNHILPDVLPDGRTVLFTIQSLDGGTPTLALADAGTGDYRELVPGSQPRFTSGRVLYLFESDLVAASFDFSTSSIGEPRMVRENIRVSGAGGQYAVSDEGTLLVIAGTRDDERQLTWVDRDGNEDDVGAAARGYAYPRISPDGGHLAVSVNDSAGNGIMIWDARREVLVPFADVEFPNLYPVWSPSGRHVAFAAGPTGDLYQKEIDSGAGHEMIDDGLDLRAPYFFSRSGEHLVFAEREPEGTVIRMIALGGNTPPVDLIRGGRNADLAPSGRHIVYQSAGESGTFEVYVRSFPDGNDLFVKISNNGGIQPVWSPDGRELFYIEPGPPPQLMTVGVSAGNDIAFSSARPLLDWPYYQAELGRTYDVDRPGGGRFLVIKPHSAEGSRLAVEIVLDWDAAF